MEIRMNVGSARVFTHANYISVWSWTEAVYVFCIRLRNWQLMTPKPSSKILLTFHLRYYPIILTPCRICDIYLVQYIYTDGRSGIESRWGRDFPPVQTVPGAHTASCKMGTESFPGVKCGRGVLLTTHPLLVPWSWKSRAIPLPNRWTTPGL